MKIIGINSSLREQSSSISQHRSFTRTLLECGLEYLLKQYDDVEVEIIDLGKFHLKPEPGAYSSNETFAKPGFPASYDDIDIIYPKLLAADGIIFSSPTYWGYPSGLLKIFFERLTALDEISDDPRKRKFQGKVAGAISTAKFDGSSRVAQDILSIANYLGFVIPPHAFAFHTGRMTVSVMEDDKEFEANYFAKRNAQAVADNIYRMVRLVNNQAWRNFQEFTISTNENEAEERFSLEKEHERLKQNDYFKDFNFCKGLV